MKSILSVVVFIFILIITIDVSQAVMWGTPDEIQLDKCLSVVQATADNPGKLQLTGVKCTRQSIPADLQKIIGKQYLVNCWKTSSFYGPWFAVTASDDHSLHAGQMTTFYNESTNDGINETTNSLNVLIDFDAKTVYFKNMGLCISN